MKTPRRSTAFISIFGTSQLHLRNPWITAWWSCAFPGFGHILLSKYIRGLLLILWETVINTHANINLALVHTFTGDFKLAQSEIDIRWMSLYVSVYLFSIYDSYRTTVDLNHLYLLADRENAPFTIFRINALEINYLDKRIPWVAATWSALMPGLGQLYKHRIIAGFYLLFGTILIVYYSHVLEGIHYTLLGDFTSATRVIDKEWFLFLPSIYGFSIFDAYANVVENNKLFDKEQANFLKTEFQNPEFVMPITQLREGG
jgi:hypothetical protein